MNNGCGTRQSTEPLCGNLSVSAKLMSYTQTLASPPHCSSLTFKLKENKLLHQAGFSSNTKLPFTAKTRELRARRAAWGRGEGEPVWIGVSPKHSSIAPHNISARVSD